MFRLRSFLCFDVRLILSGRQQLLKDRAKLILAESLLHEFKLLAHELEGFAEPGLKGFTEFLIDGLAHLSLQVHKVFSTWIIGNNHSSLICVPWSGKVVCIHGILESLEKRAPAVERCTDFLHARHLRPPHQIDSIRVQMTCIISSDTYCNKFLFQPADRGLSHGLTLASRTASINR